jgi:hypothetical protein
MSEYLDAFKSKPETMELVDCMANDIVSEWQCDLWWDPIAMVWRDSENKEFECIVHEWRYKQ